MQIEISPIRSDFVVRLDFFYVPFCPYPVPGSGNRDKDSSALTVRFGIGMLMRFYLDEVSRPEYPEWVAAIRSEE